jgi:pimeloyl-ACP methyl ester carboxylesterase
VNGLRTDDGRTLSWREAGTGPPLLCHPGGPGASSRYFGDLPELAAERTLILLDPRGTGASDRPANPSAYDLEDYAADIEAVRARLGLDRIDVLGHSHGGFVAMTWGGRHPDRVGRLVLADTAPRFTDAIRSRRSDRVAAHHGEPYFADAVAALQDQQAGRYATDEELAALYERAGPVLARPGDDIAPVAGAFRAAGINADAMKHFNERIAGAMDLRPLLERVASPALVIAGEHDPFGGPTTDEIAGALQDPTVVTIPGADHFPFLEADSRAPWSRAVLDFLG